MTPTFLLILFVLGLAGGFFSGLLGIGGGIIMVPLLLFIPTLLGFNSLSMKTIAGITMVQSLAGSLSAMLVHRRHRFVHPSLVLYMGTSSLISALIGSVWSAKISGYTMTAIFAGLALLASGILFLPIQKDDTEDGIDVKKVIFNKPKAIFFGLIIGLLGGILGQGGAFLLIPLMIYVLRIPTRITLGSSVAISFMSALAGFIGKWSTNQIPIILALILATGAVLGAQFGGYVSKKIPVNYLRMLLAILIAGTGIKMSFSLSSQMSMFSTLLFGFGLMFLFVILAFLLKRNRKSKTLIKHTEKVI